ALRPQIGSMRAARRSEEVLPPALHPAVEGASIGEVEARQPRLPLCPKDGGGDRVSFAVVVGHGSGPLVAVLDLEALLVSRRQVPVPREVVAGEVEEGLGKEIEDRVGGRVPRSRTTRVAARRSSAGSTASRYGRPRRSGVAVEARKTVMAFTSGALTLVGSRIGPTPLLTRTAARGQECLACRSGSV